MQHDANLTVDEPVPDFDIADLFLSRTDERGVIKYGNDVFRRLSQFSWPELIGAPHRKIRHPDMPKAAFHLFWDVIQSGQSFGAYVKNRAASGQYYWVFAVVVPIDRGYLSVRLKPTSSILENIQSLYSELRTAEREQSRSPEEGTEEIVRAVQALGYRDYTAFTGYALATELSERARALQQPVDPSIAQFEQIGVLLMELSKEVRRVQDGFEAISNSPANLNILGSRLKSRREPMQVVARNYGMLAAEMLGSITELADGLQALLDIAFAGRVDHCAALLYREAIADFVANEPNTGTTGHAREVERLEIALSGFMAKAEQSCALIEKEVARFVSFGTVLRKMVSGLAVTRVICLIESATVEEDTTSIEEISHRLGGFQEELSKSLDRIAEVCAEMTKTVPKGSAVALGG